MLVDIQTVGTITNLNWADGGMESRKVPPDCSYLIILLPVYGRAFLAQIYGIIMQVMQKCIHIYSHAEIVLILLKFHLRATHMYI